MTNPEVPSRESFPTNSFKSKDTQKEEAKKITPIAMTGGVVQRKKPIGTKFKELFMGADAKDVGSYLFMDVAIPAAKSLITDMVTQGIERALYGDSRPRPRSGRVRGSYTSYNRMSKSTPPWDEPRPLSRTARATHNFDEIILSSREEAHEALDRLTALIEQYDVATVSDLYELIGITGSFTDNKWGWNNLREAGVSRIREGFLLDLPKPIALD